MIKDGYLVKTWGNPSARGGWASAAKPVMSTLLLFAVQEGLLNGVDDLVKDWWLNLDGSTQLVAKDASMTFRHLANMTSGYARGEIPGAAWA
ncbi:MAG: serine hydrolase, partial [Candidatus Omnitrophica bacterium]|nr:serine hydrolase [Candidatus Omnitrophota bacterium]